MVWPPGVQGILVTEAVRGEGGVLRNRLGERFMERYDAKQMELSTRDVVARAIYTEVREGRGTEHGGAYLDISHKPADYVKKKLPGMYHQFRELADVDITSGPMEVGPTCHYMMGGVRVDAETTQTTVPGLFAAGEVAAGLHGANRLGGNSLSDLLVFGRRAGLAAAEHAAAAVPASPDPGEVETASRDMLSYFERQDGGSPYAIHRDLEQTMQDLVGIFRNAEDLAKGIEKVGELAERAGRTRVEGSRLFNPGWHLARDLQSMLTVSEAVARSALARQESRGAHSRTDFPKPDPEWGRRSIVVRRTKSGMELSERPVPEPPPELRTLLAEAT
jgi:succinate dehydrogenase / fumarate reductase flavoprotein subunit